MVNGHQNWMVFSNTSDNSSIQYLCEWVSGLHQSFNQPNSFSDYKYPQCIYLFQNQNPKLIFITKIMNLDWGKVNNETTSPSTSVSSSSWMQRSLDIGPGIDLDLSLRILLLKYRGEDPKNSPLLFQEKVARVKFVWDNISSCMGEYCREIHDLTCREDFISLRKKYNIY